MFDLSKNTGSALRPLLLATYLCRAAATSPGNIRVPLNLAAPHPCGQSTGRGRSPRIIGGKPAVAGQFPWAVRLHKITVDELVHCGGSLVTSRHVVTAAHCVTIRPDTMTPKEDWEVWAGELLAGRGGKDSQVRKVIDIKTHPSYKFPDPNHDLAIMTLNASVTWSPQVAPVCLPSSRDDFATMRAALAGWGYTQQERSGKTSKDLMWTKVTVMTNKECINWLKNHPKYDEFYQYLTITGNHICTKGRPEPGAGGCHGDSGGPLVLNEPNFTLVGVVSGGGKMCGGDGGAPLPSIYTRVSQYTDWLQENTR